MSITQSNSKVPVGSNKCQCPACGLYFGGVRAFEVHRVGPGHNRRCLDVAGMSDKLGMPLLTLNDRGYWIRTYGNRPQNLADVA